MTLSTIQQYPHKMSNSNYQTKSRATVMVVDDTPQNLVLMTE